VKSLLYKTCPPFSFFYKVNGGRAYSSDDSQRVSRYSGTQCSSDMNYLFLSQFVPRSIFSFQVNKPSAPLMSGVVSQSNPFKIFRSIVQFVSVDVIDRKARLKPRNKCQSNQSVNEHFWSFIAKFCGNDKVSLLACPRSYLGLRPNALKDLSLSKSFAFCLRNNFRSKNSGVLANKPVNSFFMNGDGFHGVHYMVGHR
jgi:hypothetical protein